MRINEKRIKDYLYDIKKNAKELEDILDKKKMKLF